MSLPTHRAPTHPGDILRYEFLEPLGLTQTAFAQHIGCTRAALNEILNGKRGITPEMAYKLADALQTSAELWMGLQADYELWHAQQNHHRIPPIKRVS
ncbi:MAG: HigA family addiction module antitoxin [Candidatus Melainabacteria bacterium]